MADGYLIGAEYLFKSNAQRELGAIAKYSAQAAEGIEALQKSTSALSATLETMNRFVAGARSSLDSMLPIIDRLSVAFGRLDAAVESIGPTAAASGAEADTAFTGVVARLEAVTVAARTAAGSLRMVGRAGATGAAGSTVQGGVGAGVAGGAAMRLAGNAAGVGGLAALATLAIGTKQRANLQDSMIQTGLAMGRSDQWVQANLLPTAMRMSMNTAQSVGDSMGLIRTMATSGINDPRDIQALSMPMARYADTQYLGKNHVPFDQSIASIAGVAHQLNLRTAGQLVPFLNTAYKISNDMPDSMKKAFTQIGYFGPGYAGSGVSPQEILKLQANADRLGYGSGKSGTGLNMLYRNLVNPTAAQYRAQRSLGLLDAKGRPRAFDAQGNFDPESLFGQVNAAQHRQFALGRDGKMAFGANLGAAFSANTGRIVGSFSSDSGLAQMRNVNATLARVPDLQTAQVRLMSSLNSQTKLLVTNFATLTAILGGPLVAPLTSFVKKLSDATGGAATYLSAHPRESGLATGALSVAAGGGTIYGLKKLGGLRIFGHIAEHEAKHSLGIGASVGVRRASPLRASNTILIPNETSKPPTRQAIDAIPPLMPDLCQRCHHERRYHQPLTPEDRDTETGDRITEYCWWCTHKTSGGANGPCMKPDGMLTNRRRRSLQKLNELNVALAMALPFANGFVSDPLVALLPLALAKIPLVEILAHFKENRFPVMVAF